MKMSCSPADATMQRSRVRLIDPRTGQPVRVDHGAADITLPPHYRDYLDLALLDEQSAGNPRLTRYLGRMAVRLQRSCELHGFGLQACILTTVKLLCRWASIAPHGRWIVTR